MGPGKKRIIYKGLINTFFLYILRVLEDIVIPSYMVPKVKSLKQYSVSVFLGTVWEESGAAINSQTTTTTTTRDKSFQN